MQNKIFKNYFIKNLIIVLFTLALISMIYFLLTDEKLLPETKLFIEQSRPINRDNNAYYYLLGIGVAEGHQPQLEGKKLYAEYLYWHQNYKKFQKQNIIFQLTDELSVPQITISCRQDDNICYQDLFSHTADKMPLLKKYSTLLERYHFYLGFKNEQTLTNGITSPIPLYMNLKKANDLMMINAIDQAKRKNIDKAIKIIEKNITLTRRKLAQADNLITKMFYTKLIVSNLDILSLIIHTYGYNKDIYMAPLSSAELDFTKVAKYEVAYMFDTFNKIKNDELNCGDEWLCTIKVKFLLKPNLTLNAVYSSLKSLIEVSHGSNLELTKFVQQPKKQKISFNALKNILGEVSKEDKNYAIYLQRIFSLNAKIQMLNATINKKVINDATLEHISNPYFKDKRKTAFFGNNPTVICFEEPIRQDENTTCLKITL